jgi:hypothetical protein
VTPLELALAAAKRGYNVLPWRPVWNRGRWEKKPYPRHSHLEASRNPRWIEAWWMQHPDARVGIVPGSANHLVVDLDAKDRKPGFETWTRVSGGTDWLDGSNWVWTSSGGIHLYFRVDALRANKTGNTLGTLCKKTDGIDIRCAKGWVAVYELLDEERIPDAPQWLLDHLYPQREKRSLPTRSSVVPARTPRVFNYEEEFSDRGLYKDDLGGGKHAVECPWSEEHSSPGGFASTVIAEPGVWDDGDLWRFKCSHTSCGERSGKDVYQLFTSAAVPR